MDPLKERLKDAFRKTPPPPEGHYDRFRSKLTEAHTPRSPRNRVMLWSIAAVAAMLVIVFIVGRQMASEEERIAEVRTSERSMSSLLAEEALSARIRANEPTSDLNTPLIRRLRAELSALKTEERKLRQLVEEKHGHPAAEAALTENYSHQLRLIERLRFAMRIASSVPAQQPNETSNL